VRRLFRPSPAVWRGAQWLLVGLALAGADARAQVVPLYPDPLAPQPNADTRNNPPRFRPFDQRRKRNADRPTTFAPVTSGVGLTGFDATNARKILRAKAKPAKPNNGAATTTTDAQAATAGTLPADVVSPYQRPIPPLGGEAMAAAPPGTPPVPEIGPIRKPPPKRKSHGDEPTDPYEATGIRVGAFDLFPAIELIGGYNTNPGATPGGPGAWLYTIEPELKAQSNWSRHELKADLRGSYTGFTPDQEPTLSRPYFDGKINSRWDVRHDTHILFDPRVMVSTDNPGSPNLQAGLAKLPVFVTYGSDLGITHSFNRFELALKGDAQRTAYQDSTLTDGSIVSNTDRNFNQYGGTLRGSYELSPGVKPFVEVGTDKRVHDDDFDVSGYQRNSKGVTALAGSTFALKGTLTGEIALGYTKRNYEDPRLEPIDGLIGNASLVWTATPLTTVKLSGSSVVGESTIPGVSGVFSRDIGLQIDHAFRRWLIGSLKLGFGVDSYIGSGDGLTTSTVCSCVVSTPGETGPDRQDLRYALGLGITYKVDRTVQVKGEFRQDWLRSNVSGNDYTASTFLVGLRFQR
jgi:hypothetical protein